MIIWSAQLQITVDSRGIGGDSTSLVLDFLSFFLSVIFFEIENIALSVYLPQITMGLLCSFHSCIEWRRGSAFFSFFFCS